MRMMVTGWVLSVVTLVLLGVAVQQAASQPQVLRARRIEVVDAAGKARVVLGVLPTGVGLSVMDTAYRPRVALVYWEIVGLTALAVAAVLLWLGSVETPWSIRTIDGISRTEKTFERRRARNARLGIVLLAAGYVLQLIVRLSDVSRR